VAGDHPFESTFSGQSLPEIQNRDKDPAIPELGYLPKPIKIIDAAAFICASAYILYSIGSYGVELEADAVASSLIGVDAVERGIHDMAIVEGSLTKKRLARLRGLGRG
jgi:hypothetical protein